MKLALLVLTMSACGESGPPPSVEDAAAGDAGFAGRDAGADAGDAMPPVPPGCAVDAASGPDAGTDGDAIDAGTDGGADAGVHEPLCEGDLDPDLDVCDQSLHCGAGKVCGRFVPSGPWVCLEPCVFTCEDDVQRWCGLLRLDRACWTCEEAQVPLCPPGRRCASSEDDSNLYLCIDSCGEYCGEECRDRYVNDPRNRDRCYGCESSNQFCVTPRPDPS